MFARCVSSVSVAGSHCAPFALYENLSQPAPIPGRSASLVGAGLVLPSASINALPDGRKASRIRLCIRIRRPRRRRARQARLDSVVICQRRERLNHHHRLSDVHAATTLPGRVSFAASSQTRLRLMGRRSFRRRVVRTPASRGNGHPARPQRPHRGRSSCRPDCPSP